MMSMPNRKLFVSLIFSAVLALPVAAFSQTYTQIAAASGYDGMDVFALGSNGEVYEPVYLDFSGTWHPSGLLPGQGTAFSQVATGDGQIGNGLQVFGLGASNGYAYLAAWQDTDAVWHSGGILPGQSTQLTSLLAGTGNNNLNVIGLGANGYPYLAAFQNDDGSWSAGAQLPGTRQYSKLWLGVGGNGELQLIGKGLSDGVLYLADWQQSSGSWTASGSLPGQTPTVSQVDPINAEGSGGNFNLQVVGLDPNNGFLYLPDYQDGSGTWHSAGILPGQGVALSSIVAGLGNGSQLEVGGIAQGTDQLTMTSYQNGNGSWSAIAPGSIAIYAAPITQAVAGNGNLNADLQIVGLGTNGHIELLNWLAYQGSWHAGTDLTANPNFSEPTQ
jgi:hypothetical protein